MGRKFCPKCGKETEKFFENICAECFISKIEVGKKLPEKIRIKECRDCGRVFLNNLSSEFLEELIDLYLMKKLKKEEYLKEAYFRIQGNKLIVTLIVKVGDVEREDVKEIKIHFRKIVCKRCWMRRTGYYQGILQIRGKDIEKIEKEVERKLEELIKKDEMAFVSEKIKLKDGIDYKIGSTKAIIVIGRMLKKKYGAKIKISRELSGIKGGKRIYRITLIARVG